MRAAHLTTYATTPTTTSMPEPVPGPGETLVRVHLAALNPFDLRAASGTFYVRPPLPYVPGSEGVGTVVTSSTWPAGTRVRFATPRPGALAELVAVPDGQLVAVPDRVDDALAAGAGVAGLAAYGGLAAGRTTAGDAVLILGATGVVGRLAVQLARIRGAGPVVAAGRDVAALAELPALGADAVVPLDARPAADLAAAVVEAAGRPIDVVLDLVWGPPVLAAVIAAAPGARVVNVGDSAGATVELPAALLRSRQITVTGYSNLALPAGEQRAALAELFEHAAAGRLSLDHEIVALGELPRAWHQVARSGHRKLLIDMTGEPPR